jgi:hypothetical protein
VITPVYGNRATITFDETKHVYYVNVPDAGLKRLYQPSVTSILKMKDKSGALINWATSTMHDRAIDLLKDVPSPVDKRIVEAIIDNAKDSYRKVVKDAADIGSLVHRVLEQELKARAGLAVHPVLPVTPNLLLAPGLTREMVDMANLCVKAGFEFFDRHELEVVQSEAPRWSPTYGYIGTGDLIAKLNGVLSVLDFKTGKRPYPEYFLQTAAYQGAHHEEFPDQNIQARWIVNVGRDGELQTESRTNETYETDFRCFLALLRVYRWNCENQGMYSKPAPQIIGPLDKLIDMKKAVDILCQVVPEGRTA